MLKEMRYQGPALDRLHEEYAKQGRIDGDAPIAATHEVRIEAPVEKVWALLSDPAGWSAIDSGIRDVHVDGPVAVDTPFVWRSGSTKLTSKFAVVEPEHELSWTGSAMGAKAVHRHLLSADGAGATVLRSEESMAGTLLGLFFGKAKLEAALTTWLNAIKSAAERA